jgi:hypothetical protein
MNKTMNDFNIEEIQGELEISGQTSIISHDLNCVIVYEQKLSSDGFKPLSGGVFSFTFTKNQPVFSQSIPTWDSFLMDFQQKRNQKFRPLWLDEEEYPEWFPESSTLKYQLLFNCKE